MAQREINVPFGRKRLSQTGLVRILVPTIGVLLFSVLLCLSIGPSLIAPGEVLSGLTDPASISASLQTILFDLRLPRILLAVSVGGALAVSGVIFQALLRNPLAEPYILGVSNGCAVGAILGFLFGVGQVGVTSMAFVGGAVVVLAVLWISRGGTGSQSESMLLGGVMVGAIGAAFIFILLDLLGHQVRSAIQWMLGDLGSVSADIGYSSVILFILLGLGSFFGGNTLNALALGEEEASSLGVNSRSVSTIFYMVASFIVGIAVSFCGAIGFIGLVVPHIIRRLVGPDHRVLLPMSVVGGGIFLLLCDTIARSLLPAFNSTGTELPVGAITALIGAPIFIYLLRRGVA